MVGINGINGVPGSTPDRAAGVRGKNDKDTSGAELVKDGVLISSEAQAAASLARGIQAAKLEPDVRAERVEAAKERIEKGDYKRPEVVAEVAKRISKYIP